ncbi:MAG TPA: TIGR00180 family glycosyltransferase [Sumerlaeia bacterium]|nr:TIGR00180 family glycosyltransferase [Sumerlaeia bacterium]
MLTLVIPTRNRPQWLRRLLLYYRREKLSVPILVADSSRDEEARANRDAVRQASETLRIGYQANDAEIPFCEKAVRAVESADSEFLVFCADDDFLIPSGMTACAEFLKNHPDYSLAHGRSVTLKISPDATERPVPWDKVRCTVYRQRAVEAEGAAQRLRDHLDNYASTFYSVHRGDQLARNLRATADHTSDVRFGELLPSALSVVQGKVKQLDALYMVRQAHGEATSLAEGSISDLLKEADFSRRYGAVRDCLAEELARAIGVAPEQGVDEIDRAFNAYLRRTRRREERMEASAQGARAGETGAPCARSGAMLWTRRLARLARAAPATLRAATVGGGLADLLRSPRIFLKEIEERRRAGSETAHFSVIPLMDPRSPLFEDFRGPRELVQRYPFGVPPDSG